MQTKAKNPGLIGVELREPIVRPFSYQNIAENPRSIGEEIREPVRRPLGTIHLLRNHKRGEGVGQIMAIFDYVQY